MVWIQAFTIDAEKGGDVQTLQRPFLFQSNLDLTLNDVGVFVPVEICCQQLQILHVSFSKRVQNEALQVGALQDFPLKLEGVDRSINNIKL